MSLIDDIKRDRESGTPGPWSETLLDTDLHRERAAGHSSIKANRYFGMAVMQVANPEPVEAVAMTPMCHADNSADASRIARVPDMEAALLAADDALNALKGCHIDFQDDTVSSAFYDALAAYREATK